ncbi:MAG: HAD family phosphatase [Miniphocaeibacter sp.]|uniref:HAD family hydrolase n=1 Tax=Miniphocaeibacter sp. TaxID=3100973 RepID=UPI00180936C3|nr:HAD family phosphatase [Gallicola sp.]
MRKVAIFDMDGTIIDSMKKWSTVLDDYLTDIGLKLDPDYRKSLNSKPMKEILDKVHKDFNIQGTPTDSFNNIMEIMRYNYLNTFSLKPGVKNALDELMNKNIKMAVATATPERVAIDAINKQGLEKYFEFIQTCDNVNLMKFQPEYWHTAAKNLNSSIENSIVFEDALYCIETVKKINGGIVAIADESANSDKDKIIALSDHYIEHYDELNYNIF